MDRLRGFVWCAVVVSMGQNVAAAKDAPDVARMWAMLQEQQAEIAALRAELATMRGGAATARQDLTSDPSVEIQLTEAFEMIEATATKVDELALAGGAGGVDTRLGAYGEVHYNNIEDAEQIDIHRFVMFLGHEFTDRLNFFSELEIEHAIAGDGKVGEVEIEQAFLQYDYADDHHAKFGVTLVPVGILNETHEPDTFYGVERNAVEKEIIPATWWEAGVALGGELAPGWRYDLGVHSGLNLDADNGSAGKRTSVRSGRQKAGKANANDLAYTARLRYSGRPGLDLGLTLQYQSDVTQGDDDGVGVDGVDGLLTEAHLVWQRRDFALKALYARWDFDDDINTLNAGADEQIGWFIEPSLRVNENVGLFARYSSYDKTANAAIDTDVQQWDVGLNYWLNPRFVLKADYMRLRRDAGKDVDGFNLGVGYSF